VNASVLDKTAALFADDSALLRAAALRLFQAAPTARRLQAAAGLLDDPVRAVRLEAAKLLIGQPLGQLSPAQQEAARAALADYQRALFARADYPETQMQIAGVAMTLRNFDAAQGALQEALRMDPQLADAWLTLARIQAALGKRHEAVETLEKSLALAGPSPDRLEMLALETLYTGNHREAREYAERLRDTYPDRRLSPEIRRLLQSD